MGDIQCPYCGADEDINHDDGAGYSEDRLHEQECGSCGKTFVFYTYIYFNYRPFKADCLNGGEHQYEKTRTFPEEYARLRCKACQHEKPLPKDAP